jgi:small GTP-binding protein
MAATGSYRDYDMIFKLMLIGESGVGKSAILSQYADSQFTPSYISTIGVDFKIRSVTFGKKIIKLQIWDTAGQERFRSITNAYYKGCHGVVLVFDVTDVNSFLRVKYWLNEVRTYGSEGVPVVLVGNKTDLKRAVTVEEAKELADKHKMQYIEVSAKNNANVDKVFDTLVGEISQKFIPAEKVDNKVDLVSGRTEAVGTQCCSLL